MRPSTNLEKLPLRMRMTMRRYSKVCHANAWAAHCTCTTVSHRLLNALRTDVEATAVVARYEETLQLLSEDVKQLSMKIGVLSHVCAL